MMCFLPNELATETSLRPETVIILSLRLTSNLRLTTAPTSTCQLGDPMLKSPRQPQRERAKPTYECVRTKAYFPHGLKILWGLNTVFHDFQGVSRQLKSFLSADIPEQTITNHAQLLMMNHVNVSLYKKILHGTTI